MRFLHTSDWHLGQKFQYRDRTQEHKAALQWLIETIVAQKIDCLIVAGDIFDIGNPPNYARRMYYRFLTRLLETTCRHIIIIGGNHDSPAMLNAPKELLEAMNMYVIGTTTGTIQDQIIELRTEKGELEAVVAAIPFLRDKDLRSSISGETGMQRIVAIRKGIKSHYDAIGAAMQSYQSQNIPLLAIGHLYVKGSYASEERANIYIGDTENIEAKQFPLTFDYIALGHIHRAQSFKGNERVQYSGSLIPLSFSETKDEKVVKVVAIEANEVKVSDIVVPLFRRLKSIHLDFEAMKIRLLQLHEDHKEELTVWVDAVVTDEKLIPNLDMELRDFVKNLNIELLKIRTTFQSKNRQFSSTITDLKDLQPLDVFLQKCESQQLGAGETKELVHTFKELQAWMIEKEESD
ncbi:MAG: exonuclease SbcCD subunit D C-terminal domain-containing protein [Bacteroidota bacterium]